MIDGLAIFITHVLLLAAFWRLTQRDDLDDEAPPEMVHRPPTFGWNEGDSRP